MKRFKNTDKQFKEKLILITIATCFIIAFFFGIQEFKGFSTKVISIFSIFFVPLEPVLLGFILTFFLYQISDNIESILNKHTKLKERHCRVIASILTLLLAILFIVAVIAIILPSIINSVSALLNYLQSSTNTNEMQRLLAKLSSHPLIVKVMDLLNIDISSSHGIENAMVTILNYTKTWLDGIANHVLQATMSLYRTLYNIFVAIFISLYMLIDKDTLIHQVSRFSKAVLPKKIYDDSVYVLDLMNFMFFKFLSGKAICSIIVGLLTVILAAIFKIQYLALIGFIMALFNMIPLFGPFISAIPCTLFAFISGGFLKAFIMLIIIVIVQQIDQNILAPNILGDIVGLDGFWIIVSITFCGSLFGVLGMIIGIPLFAVLRILVTNWLNNKEKNKSIQKDEE